eukprot:3690831-Rhodomonas_salina.9
MHRYNIEVRHPTHSLCLPSYTPPMPCPGLLCTERCIFLRYSSMYRPTDSYTVSGTAPGHVSSYDTVLQIAYRPTRCPVLACAVLRPIVLCVCHAMPDTDLGHGVLGLGTCYAMSGGRMDGATAHGPQRGTAIAYRGICQGNARQCPVLRERIAHPAYHCPMRCPSSAAVKVSRPPIVLRACYAMSGTDIGYAVVCYAMSGTAIAYAATISGTDVGYAATRLTRS